ncbi:MAG: Crp/Fnr family transcriptional regulator [Finegoldia sp.]|nr:Crp/Fnr family transcriptional regulator [Finegoldia sp.]
MSVNLFDFKLFEGILPQSIEKIKNLKIERAEFDSNQLVVAKDSPLTHVIFIEKGLLKTVEYMIDGKEIVSSYYFEGDAFPFYLYFGSVDTFPYDAYAIRKTVVRLIPLREFEKIMDEDIVLTKNVLKFVSEYTCFNKLVIRACQYTRVDQRLAYWLLHQKEVDELKFPTTQTMLADILRVNRPGLNQELKKLSENKIIEKSKKGFKILDKDYLKSLIY